MAIICFDCIFFFDCNCCMQDLEQNATNWKSARISSHSDRKIKSHKKAKSSKGSHILDQDSRQKFWFFVNKRESSCTMSELYRIRSIEKDEKYLQFTFFDWISAGYCFIFCRKNTYFINYMMKFHNNLFIKRKTKYNRRLLDKRSLASS